MLTPTELQAEYDYRLSERLGILCEDQPPTPSAQSLAKAEADAWLSGMTAINKPLELLLF